MYSMENSTVTSVLEKIGLALSDALTKLKRAGSRQVNTPAVPWQWDVLGLVLSSGEPVRLYTGNKRSLFHPKYPRSLLPNEEILENIPGKALC